MRKKILIDANPIVPYFAIGRISGIGRTCLELIKHLEKERETLPFDIELYTQNLKGISGKRSGTGFKSRHVFLRHNPKGLEWARKLRLREFTSRYDLQHITHNFENVNDASRCIVTIHDAMFFSHPEDIWNPDRYRKTIPQFARKCRHVITISEHSKREIMKFMDVPEEKISVIPWGVDTTLHYPHEPNANDWSGKDPYFVAVSCSAGRKNTISVLRAFEKFSRNNPRHHLIAVWREPTEEALGISKLPHVRGRLHFTSNLSNETLGDLYAGATASFFPSLYEGFGLPILESMSCGVPCVTADNSSLREVGGDVAIYVEPRDVDSLSTEMEKFETGVHDMDMLRSRCLKQASLFSWDKCVKNTIEVYRKALGI